MISASTRFFAQPRLIMPTFGCRSWSRSACLHLPGRTAQPTRASLATTGWRFLIVGVLINRHVLVVVFQRLSIFCDLNGVRIENANRDMFAAKFHGTICWRNPAFEGGTVRF